MIKKLFNPFTNKLDLVGTIRVEHVDGTPSEPSEGTPVVPVDPSVPHTHAIKDVLHLLDELNSKSPTGHIHQFGDVSGLTTVLNDKADREHTHEGYATADHRHGLYEIEGFVPFFYTWTNTVRDDFADIKHVHPISDIKELQATLDGKAEKDHTHDGYALTDHTHTEYALANHNHSDYALSEHTHDAYEIKNLDKFFLGSDYSIDRGVVADVVQELTQFIGNNDIVVVPTMADAQKVADNADHPIMVFLPDGAYYLAFKGMLIAQHAKEARYLDGGMRTLREDFTSTPILFDDGKVYNAVRSIFTKCVSPLTGKPLLGQEGKYHRIYVHDLLIFIAKMAESIGFTM